MRRVVRHLCYLRSLLRVFLRRLSIQVFRLRSVLLGSFNRRLGFKRRGNRNGPSDSLPSQASRHQYDKAFISKCLFKNIQSAIFLYLNRNLSLLLVEDV